MGKVREVSGAESGLQVWQTGEHLLQLKGTVAASFRGVLPRDNVTPGCRSSVLFSGAQIQNLVGSAPLYKHSLCKAKLSASYGL